MRFDPVYLLSGIGDENKNKSKIGELLIQRPQYGANQSASEYNNEFRYIRITDIDEFGNLRLEDPKSCLKFEEKYNLVEDDILMARSGATAGKCLIYKENYGKAIFAGYLIRFKFDKQKVLPKYIFYYTQLEQYDKWVNSIQRPAGQPNINSEEFQSLQIPLPPLEVQQKLADMMDEAYALKKAKETEAKGFLDSIDGYVMDKLGIKVEEKEEKKVFAVGVNSLIGGRIDPEFILKRTVISKSYFPFVELETLADVNWGNTNITKARYLESNFETGFPAFSAAGQDGFVDFFDYDTDGIILSAIGARCGKCFLAKNKWTAIKNTIVIIPKNKDVNLAYLYNYIDNESLWEKSGGAQPFITMESVNKTLIPLPPLDIQQEIATEVMSRRARAKSLQIDARNILEKAKSEFEKEILK